MTFLARLVLLFVVLPLVELMILIRIGEWVGLWPTLALVLVTGAVGASVARAEGTRALVRFRRELAEGHLPGQPLLDGISVLVGGALLLTPGILTDIAGLMLLFPPSRRWVQRRMRSTLERRIRAGAVDVVVTSTGPWGGAGDGGGRDAARDGLDPRLGIDVDPK